MNRLVEFVLAGLPLSSAARRAVTATLADWRHEASGASQRLARLRLAMRSTLALVRVLVDSATLDLRGEARSPFLWRTLMACALVVAAVGFMEPIFPTEARGSWAEVLMSLAQGFYIGSIFFPVALFTAEVTGRSTRQPPSLGSAMVLAAAVLVWVAVVAPETLNFMWTIHGWGAAGDVTPPVPSIIRWLTGEPNRVTSPLFILNRGIAWVCFCVSLWSLAVLAYRVRTFAAGSTGRRMSIVWGSVLLACVLIPAVVILPRVTAYARVPYVWTAVILLLAVVGFFAAASLAHRTAARAKGPALPPDIENPGTPMTSALR